MKNTLILCAALIFGSAAFAQNVVSTTNTRSDVVSESGAVNGGQANNQNLAVYGAAAPSPITSAVVEQRGLPVSSAQSTFVNPPSSDTCSEAGDALAATVKVFSFNGSKGGKMQVACDVRARAINAKVTGRSDTMVAVIQCQDPNTAEATEYEADILDARPAQLRKDEQGRTIRTVAFRCPDAYRPKWALEREGKRVSAILNDGKTEQVAGGNSLNLLP